MGRDITVEIERAEAVVARWRRLAEDTDGLVRLGAGVSDAAMDEWPAPVPEHIRVLARAASWCQVGDIEPFGFLEVVNFKGYMTHLLGPQTTWWALHANGATQTWYADIDPVSGQWGRVLCNDEEHEVGFRAPDVVTCFEWLADCVDVTRAYAAGTLDRLPHGRVIEESAVQDECWMPTVQDAFNDLVFNGGEVFVPMQRATAPIFTPEQAASTGDPELARAAQEAEPDAWMIADMRDLPPFSRTPSSLYGAARVQRLFGGGIVILGTDEYETD
ncbi:MAG TPA: hypothetical protein VL551_15745 [Actinospica sp.]|jgi:hypothetical protein|nr:hypothetical protein [Actinospica sp.]